MKTDRVRDSLEVRFAGVAELVVAADRAMYEAKREGTTCRVATERRVRPDAIQTHG